MTLKKLLIAPLLISLALFIYFSAEVTDSFTKLVEALTITPQFIIVVAVAAALQILGHWVRAKKTSLLFGQVKENSTRFQFRALSIGYLFNAILPLRLGELIRARIISQAMTISFGYALVMIVFERLIDAMLLGTIGLIAILLLATQNQTSLVMYALGLITIALILLAGVLALMHENRNVLRFWHKFSGLLNENLKNAARFKLWSIIYGLQQTIKPRLVRQYLLLTLASWTLYSASMVAVAVYIIDNASIAQRVLLTIAPYFGVAVPSGPANLGVFSDITDAFAYFLPDGNVSLAYGLVSWAILILPITTIGIILLFGKTREVVWKNRPKQVSRQSIENKLYRQEDISDEMKHFLDNYFSGNTLSRIVHQLERSEDFKLVRYFKGGSDAITILALQNGKEVVKKIIPLEFEDRLKAQYDWLKERNGTPGIVEVLAEERTENYYAIDLAYDPDYEMFYEYMHQNQIAKSKKVMDEVWSSLSAQLYANLDALATYPQDREAYIEKHIFGCLDKAAAVDPELIKAAEPETLVINGQAYDNLYQIIEKIKEHPQAWKDIATYQRGGAVHGDVIVDNLLVSKRAGRVLIIDPAPDGNIFNGPVFDFGKNMQSLHYGYETLLRDEDQVILTHGNHINYRDLSSDKYHRLSEYVRQELAPRYLSEPEQKAILFHAGALYIRRLKHQVYYTPANVLKFYAVGVRALNDFLAQYETTLAKPRRPKPQKRR